MQINHRIAAFSVLGSNLESFISNFEQNCLTPAQQELKLTLLTAKKKNAWFSLENQLFALKEWALALREENLNRWISSYNFGENKSKTIGIVAAGNIPMVGFHDILSVVLSGNSALVKLSSNDNVIIPYMVDFLTSIESNFSSLIKITDKLSNYNAVIATGSDNTARYFEAYFKGKPHLIRKNRTSVAVLTGDESNQDLQNLGQDIFQYFGMGCRNVTKLYLPKEYNLDLIFNALYPHKEIINHHKYANNYDYHKAIYLMKQLPILDNGFLLVKEDKALFSPIACLFYEFYDSENELLSTLESNKNQIQCIVGTNDKYTDFGRAQSPHLWDYADGVDTLKWLYEL